MRQNKKGKKRKLQYHIRRGVDPLFGPGTLLLEHCTDDSVLRWLARGQKLQNYNFKWFFELESQRAAHQHQITEALTSVPGISVSVDEWCRGIKFRYSNVPLSCIGSLKQSGRFNYAADIDPTRFPPFPALYAARDRETAYREMFGISSKDRRGILSGGDLALKKQHSIVWLSLRGRVHNVFDLTKPKNLQPFLDVIAKFTLSSDVRTLAEDLALEPMIPATKLARLVLTLMDPNWRGYVMNCDLPANSQVFGQLLSSAGFEGILYESTKTSAAVIAIFPRQFKNSTSSISVIDAPATALCCELNSSNFADCEREAWD